MTDRYDNLAKRMECTPEEIPALIQQHAPWNGRDMCNDSIALAAEVERLRGENSKLRDVLGWVEAQCPGKCAGVCFDALSGEHLRKEKE